MDCGGRRRQTMENDGGGDGRQWQAMAIGSCWQQAMATVVAVGSRQWWMAAADGGEWRRQTLVDDGGGRWWTTMVDS